MMVHKSDQVSVISRVVTQTINNPRDFALSYLCRYMKYILVRVQLVQNWE